MKIFDVDVSAKHLNFKLEGKQYSLYFRDDLLNGVHDISVWVDNKESNAEVTGAYPPLRIAIAEIWRIYAPLWFKRKIKLYRQLHNR